MRLISSFTNLTDLDLIAKTGGILTALAGNSHFPEPWPEPVSSLAALTEARAAYIAAYEAAQSRDTFKVAGKNAAKAQLASYSANSPTTLRAAGKDPTALASSGFDQRQTVDRHVYDGIPPAPQRLEVKHGPRKGSVDITCEAIAGARSYEIQTTQADPTQDANWHSAEISAQHKHIPLENLTPGQTYSFRIRAIGKNEKGLWSAAVSLMVV